MKNRLTTGLIMASFIFTLSLCLFYFGFNLCRSGKTEGLIVISITFASGIISTVFIVKCKTRIDILIAYGDPIFTAAKHIKDIVGQVNIYGVDSLKNLIEDSMKEELKKVVKKKMKP